MGSFTLTPPGAHRDCSKRGNCRTTTADEHNMEAKALLLPCNDYTKWVLDKVEEQLKMSRGAMSADMHRLYVAAACYYAGMDVKRTLPYAGRCRRSEECRKSYKEVVAPGFLRYLVETMEHSPPMALTVDLMGSTTLQGQYSRVQYSRY